MFFALGDKELDNLVKPGLQSEWQKIKPSWFVMPNQDGVVSVEQKRQPGLLKIEYEMHKGSAVMVCSKTYSLQSYEQDAENKKALKGVANDNKWINHNDFIKSVYDGINKVTADCSFKFNAKQGRMETVLAEKKATNPIYTKLFVNEDDITISPLSVLNNGTRTFI